MIIIIIIIIMILLFLDQTTNAVAAHTGTESRNNICGFLQIRFPFYLQDQDPIHDYPGPGPGFNISCRNGVTPIISLSNSDYVIDQIFYQNQSLRVFNAAVSAPDNCIPSLGNFSVQAGDHRFKLAPNQTQQLMLFCNCTSLPGLDVYADSVVCYEGCASKSALALLGDDDPHALGVASRKCKQEVVAPVQAKREVVRDMLEIGFLMTWEAISSCSECLHSGGRCGFDNQSYHFLCFCHDRAHFVKCHNGYLSVHRIKLVISTTAGIVVAALFTSLLALLCFRRKKIKRSSLDIEAHIKRQGTLAPKRYNFSEIKRITNSLKEKIGEGGFGAVYKGKLPDGHHLVAVKVLKTSKGNGQDFINEVTSISKTSHVNVVTLLGYCLEAKKRALVYEFMSNGSLDKFIYDEKCSNSTESSVLGWESLFRIAVGIARGLEYLHNGCNTRIVHFDIKPHNILLDDNFCPKISDFGLAKLCTRNDSIMSLLDARGTIGYIAPEVFNRNFGNVSHKSDVYSYGMMVLEMVGKRKNIDNIGDCQTSEEVYFPTCVYQQLELGGELKLHGIRTSEDSIVAKKMMIVALWCIQTNPYERPPISRVIEMLEGSVDVLQVPPKPYLSSPPRPQLNCTSSSTSQFSTVI